MDNLKSINREVDREVDVTADICPMTYVRTRLALDAMQPGQVLRVWLRGEEPRRNVPETAATQGHTVLAVETDAGGRTAVLIRRR